MDQIYKFNEFVLILESEKNDEKLFNDLKKVMAEDLFKRWTNCPNFGGVYAKYSKSDPSIKEIFYKWGGKEKIIKDIFYDDDGNFFYKNPFKYMIKFNKKLDEYIFNGIIFNSIKQDILDDCGASIFNPFTYNIEDLPIIKKLKEIGMEIISNDEEKSKGILVLKFKNSYFYEFFVIKPSGEIAYKKYKNKYIETSYDWEKSLEPINNLEDLIKKIIHVYIEYYFKNIIHYEFDLQMPPEKLISALKSEENINNPIYKIEYYKIIQKYPKIASYLPEPPDEDENKKLIKGVRLLNRSGLLD